MSFSGALEVAKTLSYQPDLHEELATLVTRFDDPQPFIRAMDSERILSGDWLFGVDNHELKNPGEIVGSDRSDGLRFYRSFPALRHEVACKFFSTPCAVPKVCLDCRDRRSHHSRYEKYT